MLQSVQNTEDEAASLLPPHMSLKRDVYGPIRRAICRHLFGDESEGKDTKAADTNGDSNGKDDKSADKNGDKGSDHKVKTSVVAEAGEIVEDDDTPDNNANGTSSKTSSASILPTSNTRPVNYYSYLASATQRDHTDADDDHDRLLMHHNTSASTTAATGAEGERKTGDGEGGGNGMASEVSQEVELGTKFLQQAIDTYRSRQQQRDAELEALKRQKIKQKIAELEAQKKRQQLQQLQQKNGMLRT